MSSDPLYVTQDLTSFSNSEEIALTSIHLEWDVNFETKTISGLVEHELSVKKEGTSVVLLDSSNLTIHGDVFINGVKTNHCVSEKDEVRGSKITIDIPTDLRSQGSNFRVLIFYSASPNASAVQFLSPDATKGKKYPYVFTQSQAIHARSLLPCMDSPGVKASYTAIVTAPAWCTVLMSALQGTAETVAPVQSPIDKPRPGSDSFATFYWNQPVPTSAYLIALAAGNLASRDVSPRVRIWSEPEVVEAAHFEFSETEEFVRTAEEITGFPYPWTRYDVLCLPPSFPYGGMENPCLTFATPTLLAGDRSLADVIAHEIAHSWTGNLVTNAVWNHFWLNEGWTVWLERKITSRFKKNPEVGRLSAQIGFQHLKESVAGFTGADDRFTQMVWPLQGEDPDYAFSSVPYEKGFNLLNYLETLIGTENFENFAKAYIDEYKFKTVTTGEFRDFFVKFVHDLVNSLNAPASPAPAAAAAAEEDAKDSNGGGDGKKKRNRNKNKSSAGRTSSAHTLPQTKSFVAQSLSMLRKVDDLDWNALFLTPGMPTYPIDFSNSLSTAAHDLAQRWISSRHSHALNDEVHFYSARKDMDEWSSQQKCLFLEDLLEASTSEPFSVPYLTNLNTAFGFSNSRNAEIMLRWQTLCIRANASWIYDPAVEFLLSQGRMKFVRPLLRALRSSQIGGKKIATIFAENQNTYHPIARKMLAEDLVRIDREEAEAAAAAAAAAAAQSPALTSNRSFKKTPSAPSTPGNNNSSSNGTATPKGSSGKSVQISSEEDDEADYHDAKPIEMELPKTPVQQPQTQTQTQTPQTQTPQTQTQPVVAQTPVAEKPVDVVKPATTPSASTASAAAAEPVVKNGEMEVDEPTRLSPQVTPVKRVSPYAADAAADAKPSSTSSNQPREVKADKNDSNGMIVLIGVVTLIAMGAFIYYRARK